MGQLLCIGFRGVTVNGKRYHIVKDIGEGAFSFVQHVTRANTNYALKRVLIQVEDQEEMMNKEIAAHNLFNHPNIMPLIEYEVVTKGANKEARLCFPYHQQGTVQEMIEVASITKTPIPEKQLLCLFRSLCLAIFEFHSLDPPKAHRDIKPHNLLILTSTSIVVMDLGSVDDARVTITSRKEAIALREKCAQDCTAAYRAPELFEVASECEITEKTDVWSLGCVLYALAYGDSPCDGSATSSLSPRINIPHESFYSAGLNDLICEILKVDTTERPAVCDIIERIDQLLPNNGQNS